MIEKTHKARFYGLLREVCDIQKCGFGLNDPTYKTVADYLIAHGVLVPPVAVGQTVYVIDKSEITENVVREIYIYKSKRKFEIRMHISLSTNRTGLLYRMRRNTPCFSYGDISRQLGRAGHARTYARGDRVRLACKRWSVKRESSGFSREECQSVLEDFRMYGDESDQIVYKFIERELTGTTQKYRVGLSVLLVVTVEAKSAEDASKKAKELWGCSDLGLLVNANCDVTFVEDEKGNLY